MYEVNRGRRWEVFHEKKDFIVKICFGNILQSLIRTAVVDVTIWGRGLKKTIFLFLKIDFCVCFGACDVKFP